MTVFKSFHADQILHRMLCVIGFQDEHELKNVQSTEICRRTKTNCAVSRFGEEEFWSGREDLNLRPLRPERSALPG